jgi:beta-mannosidase
MREAYRPRVLHFSGAERRLILINDTDALWHDMLNLHLVGKHGEVLEQSSREVVLGPRSQASYELSDAFKATGVTAIDGYLVAELGEIRTARRIWDAAVQEVCGHNVTLLERVDGNQVQVLVQAECFIHELSILPELVAADHVTVSAQRVTLLPGESVNIVIDCSHREDAERVARAIEEITWSLNRLLNGVDLI